MLQGIQTLCFRALKFLRYFFTRTNENGNLRDFTLMSVILILYTSSAETSTGVCQSKNHLVKQAVCTHLPELGQQGLSLAIYIKPSLSRSNP